MLPSGTRMSDIDATVADTAEQASCPECGHDAGECTCAEDAAICEHCGGTSIEPGVVHVYQEYGSPEELCSKCHGLGHREAA